MKINESIRNASKRLGRYVPPVAGGILGTPMYVIGSPVLGQVEAAYGSHGVDSQVRYMMNEFRRKKERNEPLTMGDGFDMGKALVAYPAHWVGKRFGEMGLTMLPVGLTREDIERELKEQDNYRLNI